MAIEQDRRISEVVRREQSRLRNSIRRRVSDPRDAEDILQERLPRAGGSEPAADADRARHPLAVSRGAQSHHRSLPQEEAGEL